jgi:putative membrane protein
LVRGRADDRRPGRLVRLCDDRPVGVVLRIVVNAAALALAAWLFEGIRVGGEDTVARVLTLLGVGAILGLVNVIVAPVIKLLSLPFIVVTLGLFLLVINAVLLLLTSRIGQALNLSFAVDGFWTAVGGALVVSIAASVLHRLLEPDD